VAMSHELFQTTSRMADSDQETDELLVAVHGAEVEHLHDSVDLRSVDGVPVFVVTPLDVGEVGDTRPIYLDIHGGSLLMGGARLAR